jgi:mandelate racemase
MAPTIRGLRVRAERVPMAEPHRTASGVVAESPLVLIDLETSEGVTGHAFVFTYTVAALKPLADLVANLEPLVAGQPLAPEALTRALLARFRLLGPHGLTGMAISGIDMAAWDALARLEGVPLCKLLGAAPRPTPAYGGIGYDGAKECGLQAERWVRRGMKGVKAKIGYPTVDEDLAVIRAMRAAVGPGVAIMVDYNQSLTVEEATSRLARLDAEGLAWVEEPVQAEDYRGMASVASAAATPIQAGENWWGPLEFSKAIHFGASDLLMPDVMKVFGVTGWRELAPMASTRELPVSSHLFCEVSAHLLAATPTAHWLEYMDWWNPVLAHPLEIRDGMAIPSDRPGSGVEWR